jgi:hypothetical protein
MLTSNRDLASHDVAWNETRGKPGFPKERPLSDDLVWGTAATAHTISWLHVDDDGFATCVAIKAGSKYWILLRSRPKKSADDYVGDMGTIDAYPSDWAPSTNSGHAECEAEGLLLMKGSVL